MDSYITPVITNDGSISLFNNKINDVYHSKIGAATEALQKFILPSGIIDYVKENNYVKILDVCFGLGYNSMMAVKEIRKVNKNCTISIDCLEYDPNLLALSSLAGLLTNDNSILDPFILPILSKSAFRYRLCRLLVTTNTWNILQDKNRRFIRQYLSEYYKSNPVRYSRGLLHNIYYRYISDRNDIVRKTSYKDDLTTITYYIGDARNAVLTLKEPYNFVFHDPFTPSKAPLLWTVDFFKELYRLLGENGNLTTYSSSSAVRSGLIDAGFYIGNIDPVGRKYPGTFACKKKADIKSALSNFESGLLNTNAGIPYYDVNFKLSNSEVLSHRELTVNESTRPSTSKYYREHGVK